MAWDYYEFLGVDPDVAPDEVKRACFRKRKALAIAKDEKGQAYLNELSQTLLDPQARVQYDALQQHGDEITRLIDDANSAVEEERWDDAIRFYKRALVMIPDQPFALGQLGWCYRQAGKFVKALTVTSKLVRTYPDIPHYWDDYGFTLLDLAEITPQGAATCPHCKSAQMTFAQSAGLREITCADCDQLFTVNFGGDQLQLLNQAREKFHRAIALEDHNAMHYLGISRSYEIVDDFVTALDWAEKSVGADGKVDMQDLETLFYIARLHAHNGQLEKIDATALRILAILPDDTESREYAGYRLAKYAYDLGQLRAFKVANAYAIAAQSILPGNTDIQQLAAYVSMVGKAYDEFNRLQHDPQINDAMIQAAAFFIAQTAAEEVENGDTLLDNICAYIDSFPSSSTQAALARLRQSYPNSYACGNTFFDELDRELTQTSAAGYAESTERPTANNNASGSSAGCSCALLIVCVITGACIGGIFGAIFGLIIGGILFKLMKF